MNEQNNNVNNVNTAMSFNTPNVSNEAPGQIPVVNPVPVAPASPAVGVNPPVNPAPVMQPVNNAVPSQPVAPVTPDVNPNPVPPVMPDASANPVPPVGNDLNNPIPPVAPVAPVAEPNLPADPEEKPKKKTSPIVIIALILVLLVGAAAGYYFLLETPQKIFQGAYNKVLSSFNGEGLANSYFKYDLKLNVTDKNGLFDSYKDIINNVSISGTSGYDSTNKQFNTANVVSYKGKQLVDLNAMFDLSNSVIYAKLNNIYDKVLMVKGDEYTSYVSGGESASVDDYLSLKDDVMAALNKALDSADCKKELAVLEGARVTKSTLNVNKTFTDAFYDSLLQNNNFLTKLAKLDGTTVDEVKEDLKDSKDDALDENMTVVLYTSLIKNDMLRFELIAEEGKLLVSTTTNGYKYEIYEGEELSYSGLYSSVKNGANNDVTFSVDMPDFGIGFTVNCSYAKADKPAAIDTNGAVNVDNLTDEETSAITSKLMENEGFKALISDLGVTGSNDFVM